MALFNINVLMSNTKSNILIAIAYFLLENKQMVNFIEGKHTELQKNIGHWK